MIKLKLLHLHLILIIIKILKYFISLLLFGLSIKKVLIGTQILFLLFQPVLKKEYNKSENQISNNCETIENIDFPNKNESYSILIIDQHNEIIFQIFFHHIIYGILIFIIICLIAYIFKDNIKVVKFQKPFSTLNINQLIIKGKVELALKKLHHYVKKRDEDLEDEISSLLSELVRCKKDSLSGILSYEDFQIITNRIVRRVLDVLSELKLQ